MKIIHGDGGEIQHISRRDGVVLKSDDPAKRLTEKIWLHTRNNFL